MGIPVHDFHQCLADSFKCRPADMLDRIGAIVGGIAHEIRVDANDGGRDFVVHMPNGFRRTVDGKLRKLGTKRHWRTRDANGESIPELTIEVRDQLPHPRNWRSTGKPGWTLDRSKQTDLVLYYFEDIPNCFIEPFEFLRRTSERYLEKWLLLYGKHEDVSYTSTYDARRGQAAYYTACIYVPQPVVRAAVEQEMKGALLGTPKDRQGNLFTQR